MKVIKCLYYKEMLGILRDKKTLLMMILMPVVIYPLMMLFTVFLMSTLLSVDQDVKYRVGCDRDTASFLSDCVLKGKEDGTFEERGFNEMEFVIVNSLEDYREKAKAEGLNVYLYADRENSYIICYDSSETTSSAAYSQLGSLLEHNKEIRVHDDLVQNGLNAEEILNPFVYKGENLATSRQTTGMMLGMILPIIMIACILLGALYPAIDVSAGEKERGTLETMFSLPITNFQLLIGKFLSVSTIAGISSLLSLLSMSGVTILMYSSMKEMLPIAQASDSFKIVDFIPAILILCFVMIVFSIFISAILICICFTCSSFKEAQNVTTPIMLIVLFASMSAIIPSLKLEKVFAIPVVNISVLVRDIFSFNYDFRYILLVLLTNVIYAAVVVILMSRLFRSESIMFSDGMNNITFFTKRSNIVKKEGTVPGIGDMIILVGVALLLYLTLGSYLSAKDIVTGTAVTQLIFLLLCILLAWYIKADFGKLFSLKKPDAVTGIQVPAVLMLWIGLFVITLLISPLLYKIFPSSAEALAGTDDLLNSIPFGTRVILVACLPPICEECLFRGMVLGCLKNKLRSMWPCILLCAALFGFFHMSLIRFIPTFLLGLALSYITYRTGKIYLSVLFHFVNNFISLFLDDPDFFGTRILEDIMGRPIGIQVVTGIACAVLVALGILILEYSVKKSGKVSKKEVIVTIDK